jgi:predicted transcriptional regulator
MTRSRKYLYKPPNAEKIKQLAEEILECELKLDRAISDNKKNKRIFWHWKRR